MAKLEPEPRPSIGQIKQRLGFVRREVRKNAGDRNALGALSLGALAALLVSSLPSLPVTAEDVQRPTPTLEGKFVVGFQGWFKCPGDGRPGGKWVHWFIRNQPDAPHAHFDFVPETAEWPADSRCATELATRSGRPVFVFSDQYSSAVMRQFEWMRQYGIDAAALQRFVAGVASDDPDYGRPALDTMLNNVRRAAEATGRGFFVMYDIARADPERWAETIEADWRRLIASGVVASPAYQRHRGRPVLAIAGLGHPEPRPGTPERSLATLAQLRQDSAPLGGVTILGLGPTYWRTLTRRTPVPSRAGRRSIVPTISSAPGRSGGSLM